MEQDHTQQLSAIEYNLEHKIRDLIEKSGIDCQERTALHSAIEHKSDPSIIHELIKKDILYCKDNQGRIPLHTALEYKSDPSIIHELIKKGNLNFKDKQGRTPLHTALEYKSDPSIIHELIKKGYLCFQDKHGRIPLHTALENKSDPSIIHELIKEGFLFIKDNLGRIPLHTAIEYKSDFTIIHELIKKSDLHIQDYQGRIALHTAIEYKSDLCVIQELLKKSYLPMENLEPPLFYDAFAFECDQLTTYYAETTIKDIWGRTSLHTAIQFKSDPSIIQELIHKSNLDIQDCQGRTPLHTAIDNNMPHVISALFFKRANLDLNDQSLYAKVDDLKRVPVSREVTLYDALVLRHPHDWSCVEQVWDFLSERNTPFLDFILREVVASKAFCPLLHTKVHRGGGNIDIYLDGDTSFAVLSWLSIGDVVNLFQALLPARKNKRPSESSKPMGKRRKLSI